MSNIYEALEQACREKTSSGVSPQLALQTEVARGISLSDEMAWLHHQVEFLLANTSHKLIQFMGSRRGEGVSTIVREFAKIAVERHGKSVLVLDSAYQDPARRINFNVTCEYGWLDLMEKGELIDKAFFRFGDSNLYFAPISVQASLVPPIEDISATITLWEKLKERFDLILIDSSSDANTSESIALSRNVDGVVLVVEAGKTRRHVAESVKKKILANGGLILGVVLNKRRYYIPEALYKLL
jgi:Mrp family chromosome partitioning ATPase